MNMAQWLLKYYWHKLFPIYRVPGSNVTRNVRGDIIGKATGINWTQIGKRLNAAADTMERVERTRKLIEKAIEENPLHNGLPF